MSLEDRTLLSVALNLEVPDSSSYGVNNSLVVQYTNTGTSNALAPVLLLSADKANLWLPTNPAASGPSLQLLATNPNPNGPAGTLAPGASGSIVVDFTSTDSTDGDPIHFSIGQLTPGQTIDWSSVQSSMRPSYINSSAWNAVFANFKANVGSTTDSYQAALDADATYLAGLGEQSNDVAGLIAYEISKSDNDIGTAPQGSAIDLAVPTPGPDLSFARSFQPSISGRNQTGSLGVGWTSNWDIRAATDSQGNVTISAGGGLRYFAKQGDGSYAPVLGDSGTLTPASGGGYLLTEIDGSLTAFYANGKLNYVQDPSSNRITATYNAAGQMVGLTESNGARLTLTPNSQGFIGQITDPTGEIAKYTYDTAGHLQSVTTPQGTIKYTYVPATGTGADNALQSIVNPDGTQLNYTYDSQGRLTGSFFGTAANPIERMTITYLLPGGVSYTDANGHKTTIKYTALGQAALITDPLGNTTRLSYDPSGDLTDAVLPDGTTNRFTYDLQGNLASKTDGRGYTTSFTYDAKGNLTSYTDANGNLTRYDYYNNTDNLQFVTYANGNKQQYSYDSLGEVKQFINARGQTVGYQYNTQGQITTESFSDGTSYSYKYDAHGNLTSATDAQGRVTTFIYGGDPNNPNNPDLLTEVKYPDNTYLKFSYNAGGQRKQSVDQTGFTVNYTYDVAGRLTKLTDGSGSLIVQYTYDPAGNLIQKDNGNGTRTAYNYYDDGNVKSITNLAADHTTINSFDDYTYDALGNVHTDTNQDGQWVYTYDQDSQLKTAIFTPSGSNPDGLAAQSLQYSYDPAGNRSSQTVNGVTTTYVPTKVNEYKSSTTNGIDTNYQYDADGNLTAETTGGVTTTYTFNALSQLTGINGPGLKASYFYDPLGNRVSQTVNSVTTNFQIDPAGLGNVVAAFTGSGVYNNSGLLAHYTYGIGLVSQVSTSGSAAYYDFNLIGSTVGITNSAGSYLNKYSYLPFGQTSVITAGLTNPFTYVGQFGVRQDASNEFAMGAREYTPGTGQFLSNDPLGLAGGDGNVRRYAANNPMSLVDPEGTDAQKSWYYKTTDAGTAIYLIPGSGLRYVQTKTGETNFVPKGSWSKPINGEPYMNSITGKWDTPWDRMSPNLYDEAMKSYASQGPTGSGASSSATGNMYVPPSTSVSGAASYGSGYGPSVAPHPSVTPRSESEIDSSGAVPTVTGKVMTPLTTKGPTAMTDNRLPRNTPENGPFENKLAHIRVWLGTPPGGGKITKADVEVHFTNQNSANNIDFLPNSPQIHVFDESAGQYSVWVDVTFRSTGTYGTTVIVRGTKVETPDRESWIVYDAPLSVQPVNLSVPAGKERVEVATFKDTGNNGQNGTSTYSAWIQYQGTSTRIPTTDITYSNGQGIVYADVDYSKDQPGPAGFLLVGVYDNPATLVGQPGGATVSDNVTVASATQPPFTTTIYSQLIASMPGDPPLVLIDTTDPSITSASQVAVRLGPRMSLDSPTPLVTGVTLTHLAGGVTQIEVEGVVNTVQPGAGLVLAVPLYITLGNEPTLTAQIEVDESSSDYVVNPVTIIAAPGQPLQNVQVATITGPANGAYSAIIDWGDGETSNGVLTALGGGQYIVMGSKPHPYGTAGMNTIRVAVNGPGAIPASAAQTTVTVAMPDLGGGGGGGEVGGGGGDAGGDDGGGGGGGGGPAAPHVPPLLALLNSLLAAIEKMYDDHTTFTGSFFGIHLLDETYDDSGNLVSATLLGIDIKTWAEMI